VKLYTFLSSCLLAFIAGHIVNYSIIFLALEWFNSHLIAGIGYGLCFGPPIILGWFAGVYCDRYSPRLVILIAQNSFLVSIALLYFALDSTPSIQQILLLVAALFSGIGWSFVAPARFATLPFYVDAKKLAGAAIALNLMVMTGFGLAPMLLKQIEVNFHWQAVLIFAASLFILSSALLVPLHFRFKAKPTDKAWREVTQSLSFVKQSAYIKQLLSLSIITYLLMGPMQVLLPSIARNSLQLNETQQGNYLSLIALALIIGGLFAMKLKQKGNLAKVMMGAIALAGAGIGYLGIETNLIGSIATLAIASISGGIAISFIVAGLQAFSDNAHRGRVMSFYSIISQCIPAISGVAAGAIAQIYSPAIALQIIGTVIVVGVTICFVCMKKFSQLESFEHV
jgi:MFS family permease